MFVAQNTVQSITDYYRSTLKEIYPAEEVDSIITIVFEHFKGWSKVELRMNQQQGLSESELLQFHWTLKRLKKAEPIQYILGETEFYGLPFKVNSSVLIPRPETEELVDAVLKILNDGEKVLDIGTGSGCIPIAIKKNRDVKICAVDVSEEALTIAKENASLNKADVQFLQADILQIQNLDEIISESLDVIISNPPYIPHKEKQLMHKNVLDHEPSLALFVEDDDPLIFYRHIGELAYKKFQAGGKLFFEVNEHLGNDTVELLQVIGFNDIRLLKDLQNKDRIVAAIR